jgi:hypothetical protein
VQPCRMQDAAKRRSECKSAERREENEKEAKLREGREHEGGKGGRRDECARGGERVHFPVCARNQQPLDKGGARSEGRGAQSRS